MTYLFIVAGLVSMVAGMIGVSHAFKNYKAEKGVWVFAGACALVYGGATMAVFAAASIYRA